jgi:F-type H+-transporting ATPase subunit epsilon
MNFQLISATGIKFEGEAYEVLVPTESGTIAIFKDHMPLLSAGAPGVISVRKKAGDRDDDMENFAVAGGIIQVDGQNTRFVSHDVTTPEEVSEKEAEEARARAEELMRSATTQIEIHEAKRLLQHSSAKLQIARLKRRHHN